MIEIKIPFKTPTINHLYWHRGNMKIMTKEARDLKEKIIAIVEKEVTKEQYENIAKMGLLKVEVEIHENWWTKDGKNVKKKDISNREKFLIDSIFDALDTDDRFIFEHTMRKVQSKEEFAVVRIKQALL